MADAMKLRRLTVRAVMTFVALLGGVFAVLHWMDPVIRFRRDRDEDSLRAVLSRQVENGDPTEKVESMLGPGETCNDPRVLDHFARAIQQFPSLNPRRFEPTDELRCYATGPNTKLYLQYRGGRLVNFSPRQYDDTAAFWHNIWVGYNEILGLR